MEILSCPNGYSMGHDYDLYDECSSECAYKFHNQCRNYKMSCLRKADFGSFIIANEEAIKRSTKEYKYNSYKCDFCSGWHIGRVRK